MVGGHVFSRAGWEAGSIHRWDTHGGEAFSRAGWADGGLRRWSAPPGEALVPELGICTAVPRAFNDSAHVGGSFEAFTAVPRAFNDSAHVGGSLEAFSAGLRPFDDFGNTCFLFPPVYFGPHVAASVFSRPAWIVAKEAFANPGEILQRPPWFAGNLRAWDTRAGEVFGRIWERFPNPVGKASGISRAGAILGAVSRTDVSVLTRAGFQSKRWRLTGRLRNPMFIERAVEKLAAYLEDEVPGQLRIVESETGMDANALQDPLAVVRAHIRWDNRVPLLGVFCSGFNPGDQRQDIWDVECTVAVMTRAEPDLETGTTYHHRYITAIIRALIASPSLNGEVISAVISQGSTGDVFGDQAATRLVYLIPVAVRVRS